jgi:hypothetical protein
MREPVANKFLRSCAAMLRVIRHASARKRMNMAMTEAAAKKVH